MKRSLLALALVAIMPFAAHADDKLSYSYVEADYLNVDGDADGFGLRGSLEFGDSGLYGFGGYSNVEVDDFDIDVDTYDLGLGYAHDLSTNTDLIGEVAYLNSEAEGFDVDGWRASAGIRGSFTPDFEGLAKVNYIDGDELDGDFSATLGAQYKFTPMWGITGEVELADDSEAYLLGVRASF